MTEAAEVITAGALLTLAVLAAAGASAHAILNKEDVRGAIGWVGLICLVPGVGAILYWLFGINRIRRRASELRPSLARSAGPRPVDAEAPVSARLPASAAHLRALAQVVGSLTGRPLTAGNAVTPLTTGVGAFEVMLAAIDGAERSVALASYIFESWGVGERFVAALAAAHDRGIAVRVLVDGVGVRYASPAVPKRLRPHGVPTATFLPTVVPVRMQYVNLRNHRKILLVDGRIGFTGGMNIRDGYLRPEDARDALRDVHFRIEGPVVAQMMETFAEDWSFCTGETLTGDAWYPALAEAGGAAARCIESGPDLRPERIRWTMLGALSRAERRVRIITPYFLPDAVLATSLRSAALRGVAVEVLLPEHGNLRLVQWASKAKIGTLLAAGCRVWETPPPFDHCKVMTVDGTWSLIGSANWDERSLRLNFELDAEVYDPDLTARLDALFETRRAAAKPLTAAAVGGRPLAVKLRDGGAWLLSPYL